MLQTLTIKETTLGLLKTLMHDETLTPFCLVGGTALALYMGHRKSVDIDLFSQQLLDVNELERHLMHTYDFQTIRISNATLIGQINDVKVDCIMYPYPLVEPVQKCDEIRIFSIPDIAAMKLTAISQSGKRLKDFVDVAFLSSRMSLDTMMIAFEKKYPKTSVMSAVRGLTYYDDIDFSAEIDLTDGTFRWKIVEKRLKEMITHSDKVLPQLVF